MKNKGIEKIIQLPGQQDVRVLHWSGATAGTPTLVCVHGAPGSASTFKRYVNDSDLRARFNILAYDRPGYGAHGSGSVTSLQEQSKTLHSLLDHLQIEQAVLLGHSFGGPIALQAVLDQPDRFLKIVLAAVQVDPDHEKYFWLGPLTQWSQTKWAVPRSWRVAGDEKYTHEEELEVLRTQLHRISHPVVAIHCEHDPIVPFENLDFIIQSMPNATVQSCILPGRNHMLIFGQMDTIKNLLLT